jgi:hypothetical protein
MLSSHISLFFLSFIAVILAGELGLEEFASTLERQVLVVDLLSYDIDKATHKNAEKFFNERLLKPGVLLHIAQNCSPTLQEENINHTGAFLTVTNTIATLKKFRLSLISKLVYTEMNGYYFYMHVGDESLLPSKFTSHYFRVPAVLALLRMGHPFVVYADRDTFITPNTAIRLENFITKDINLQQDFELCSCAFSVKNSDIAVQFLSAWWDLGHTGCCSEAPAYEQNSFSAIIRHWTRGGPDVGLQDKSNVSYDKILPWSRRPDVWTRDLFTHPGHAHVNFIGEGRAFTQPDLVGSAHKQLNKRVPIVNLVTNMWAGRSNGSAMFYHTANFFWKLPSRLIFEDTNKWLEMFRIHRNLIYPKAC